MSSHRKNPFKRQNDITIQWLKFATGWTIVPGGFFKQIFVQLLTRSDIHHFPHTFPKFNLNFHLYRGRKSTFFSLALYIKQKLQMQKLSVWLSPSILWFITTSRYAVCNVCNVCMYNKIAARVYYMHRFGIMYYSYYRWTIDFYEIPRAYIIGKA